MGAIAILRLQPILIPHLKTFNNYLLAYLIFRVIIASLLCLTQVDMKKLVAYSSIVHMSLIILLIFRCNILSNKALLIIVVYHAFSSPILFQLVGIIQEIQGTRNLLLIRSILSASPLLSLLVTLAFFLNVQLPPTPGFISEVLLFLSINSIADAVLILTLLSLFLVLLYTLLWYLSLTTSKPTNSIKTPLLKDILALYLCGHFSLVSLFFFFIF